MDRSGECEQTGRPSTLEAGVHVGVRLDRDLPVSDESLCQHSRPITHTYASPTHDREMQHPNNKKTPQPAEGTEFPPFDLSSIAKA